ncbi:hypothetical protein PENSPDRAFT_691104 [Peniophora sp. CONT]|nr:hypothetical protein PENSPDRAFT_691104 [Peniophora sp. CONT]
MSTAIVFNLNMTSERVEALVRRSLSCHWAPVTQAQFDETLDCAEALFHALVWKSDPEAHSTPQFLSLPERAIEAVFLILIREGGDTARCTLRGVCRAFRCVVFKCQDLWTDVTSFPPSIDAFMAAYLRSRWTSRPLSIRFDGLNRGRIQRPIPTNTLISLAFSHLDTLVVEHRLNIVGLLRILHRARHLPSLKTLVLTSEIGYPGFGLARAFENILPTVIAPSLQYLQLRCVYLLLQETTSLRVLRVDARVNGSNMFCLNRWPSRMLRNLLRSNGGLTVLHLVDAVKVEENRMNILSPVSLPALQELLICSATTSQPAWLLQTLDFPHTTHLRLHLGYGAAEAFDMDIFFRALGPHLRKRTIHSLVALPSFYLTGLLLSHDPRSTLPYWVNDPGLGALDENEVPHTLYAPVDGAVDMFFLWDAPGVDQVSWKCLFDGLSEYIHTELIRSVELNAEYEMDSADAFALFEDAWLPNVTKLRLWRDDKATLVSTLINMCTPCHDEGVSSRRLLEALLSMFPMLRRIVDVDARKIWDADTTVDLLEQILNGQGMQP